MQSISKAVTRGYASLFLVPLSLAAGIVHAALVGEHMSEYTWYGYGFVGMAAFQLIWGLAAFRGASRGLVALGLAGNLAFLATWALSRVAGLPFGPHLWEREAISFVDLLAVVPEVAFVSIAATMLRQRRSFQGAADQSALAPRCVYPSKSPFSRRSLIAMKSILKHAVAVSALTVALAGCAGSESGTSNEGGRGSSAPASSSGKADSKSVVMELIQFKPDNLEVAAGTTVTWTQKDAGAHTVTSGTVEEEGGGVSQKPDGKFDSGQVATGETFKHEFSEPGVYTYFCSIHPATMRGEVKVS